MGKKKKIQRKGFEQFIGATVEKVVKNDYLTEIHFKLANGKKQTAGLYEEGSYSDWWETKVNYRPNSEIAYWKEYRSHNKDDDPIITLKFYNNENKVILEIIGIFHNDSCWDYGCYMEFSCQDLNVDEYYYA